MKISHYAYKIYYHMKLQCVITYKGVISMCNFKEMLRVNCYTRITFVRPFVMRPSLLYTYKSNDL